MSPAVTNKLKLNQKMKAFVFAGLALVLLSLITTGLVNQRKKQPNESDFNQLVQPSLPEVKINKVEFLVNMVETPSRLGVYSIQKRSISRDLLCQQIIDRYQLDQIETTNFDPNLSLWRATNFKLNCSGEEILIFSDSTNYEETISLEEAQKTAREFLDSLDIPLPKELIENAQITLFKNVGANNIEPTSRINEANLIQLNIFSRVENYSIYGPNYPEPTISFLVGPQGLIKRMIYSPIPLETSSLGKSLTITFANAQKLIETDPESLTILDYRETQPTQPGYVLQPPNLEKIDSLLISQVKLVYYPTNNDNLAPAYLMTSRAQMETGEEIELTLLYSALAN